MNRIFTVGLPILVGVLLIPVSIFAASKIPANTLQVNCTQFHEATKDVGEPIGQVCIFEGWTSMRLLVTQRDQLFNESPMLTLKGTDALRLKSYTAGLEEDIILVRSGNSLQVQRETKAEEATTPNKREPLLTMYLPKYVKVMAKTK